TFEFSSGQLPRAVQAHGKAPGCLPEAGSNDPCLPLHRPTQFNALRTGCTWSREAVALRANSKEPEEVHHVLSIDQRALELCGTDRESQEHRYAKSPPMEDRTWRTPPPSASSASIRRWKSAGLVGTMQPSLPCWPRPWMAKPARFIMTFQGSGTKAAQRPFPSWFASGLA